MSNHALGAKFLVLSHILPSCCCCACRVLLTQMLPPSQPWGTSHPSSPLAQPMLCGGSGGSSAMRRPLVPLQQREVTPAGPPFGRTSSPHASVHRRESVSQSTQQGSAAGQSQDTHGGEVSDAHGQRRWSTPIKVLSGIFGRGRQGGARQPESPSQPSSPLSDGARQQGAGSPSLLARPAAEQSSGQPASPPPALPPSATAWNAPAPASLGNSPRQPQLAPAGQGPNGLGSPALRQALQPLLAAATFVAESRQAAEGGSPAAGQLPTSPAAAPAAVPLQPPPAAEQAVELPAAAAAPKPSGFLALLRSQLGTKASSPPAAPLLAVPTAESSEAEPALLDVMPAEGELEQAAALGSPPAIQATATTGGEVAAEVRDQ